MTAQDEEVTFKGLFVPFTSTKAIVWIVIVGFAIYCNSLFNDFVWDDIGQIVSNPLVQNLSNTLSFFTGSTFYSGGATSLTGLYYKPLLLTFFSIIYAFWGLNSFGYHLFSLVLHITNAILLYILFNKLFKESLQKYSNIVVFLLTLLFLTHPVNVEAVAYISGVQEIVYTFFLLISLLLITTWNSNKEVSKKKIFFTSLFFLLSLLSKETGIITFPILIVYGLFFIPSKIKQLLLSLGISCTAYTLLRFGIAHVYLGRHAVASPIVNAPLTARLTTIPYELYSYARLIFFPKDLFISQNFVLTSLTDQRFFISLFWVVLLVSLFAFLFYRYRSTRMIFFTVWIIVSFVLILNIYPLDFSLAERWLYGPLIGILGFLGAIVLPVKNKRMAAVVIICFSMIIALFSARTIMRNFDWKDNMTLFAHDIVYNPASYEIQEDYGTLLSNSGNFGEGKKHLLEAVRLSPTWWSAYTNVGLVYEQEHQFQKAEKYYLYAIDKGRDYGAYQALAVLEYKNNNLQRSLIVVADGLTYYPDNPTLNLVAALTYYKMHDLINAQAYAKKAYALHPTIQTYTALTNITNGDSIDDIVK